MTSRAKLAICVCFVVLTCLLRAESDLVLTVTRSLSEGSPDRALEQIQNLEETLGRPTPRVESLKVYAYVALQDWKNARIALTRYKQLVSASASSEAHQALLKLEPQIDRGLADLDSKWRKNKEQAEALAIRSLGEDLLNERKQGETARKVNRRRIADLAIKQLFIAKAEPPPPLTAAEISEDQIMSLVSEPDELVGWLAINADTADPVLVARLRDELAPPPVAVANASGAHYPLAIVSNPGGATVWVHRTGAAELPIESTAPFTTALPTGRYTLYLFLPGHVVWQETIELDSAGYARTVNLSPLPADPENHGVQQPSFRAARRVNQVAPTFPAKLRREDISGSAVISFIVNVDGVPDDVHVESSTHPAFGDAAVEAIKKWRFEPATYGGVPMEQPLQVPIRFDLE